MRLFSLLLGSVLIAVGLITAAFLWSWVWSVLHYAPELRWLVFTSRCIVLVMIVFLCSFGGWALVRLASAMPVLARVTNHRPAKAKLAWDHIYRALVVGNPAGALLTLIETAPPVAQYILDQAFEDGNPRSVYEKAVAFVQVYSQHGPLDPAPLPPISPELLSPAVREACAIYAK